MTQSENLGRVSKRIAEAIVDFCVARVGKQFHADELRQYVTNVIGDVAPGSADRVLRDLRQSHVIDYRVINRRHSLYEVLL